MGLSLVALLPYASGQDTGQYDEQIDKIVKKISQYPQRTRDLGALKENFDKANGMDNEYIMALLTTGQPDIWLDIYGRYAVLDLRQKKVMTIPEKSLALSGIQVKDYERELKDSKYKAMSYHYAYGEKLLKSESQPDWCLAYKEFLKVARLDPSFKDLDKLLRKAMLKGSTSVEFELLNMTGEKIGNTMVGQLTVIVRDFKKEKYGQAEPDSTGDSFPIVFRVVLNELKVGQDQYKEVQYQEERDVYMGEMSVDTIKCLITETRQLKKAMLSGSIEYIDKRTGQIVNRVPVRVESIFSNAYASLQGNPEAAGEDTRELLRSKKTDFPSGDQMIMDATEEFTRKVREMILSD